MTNTAALLALMQVSDSAFPSGAFVHSYGLEQLVREQRITDALALERFVTSVLEGSLATADAPVAYAAASARNINDLIEIDRALFGMKAASELREACVGTGRRFLDEASFLHDQESHPHVAEEAAYPLSLREKAGVRVPLPEKRQTTGYLAAVRTGATPGCYPVAYGVVCRDLGVAPTDVPGVFLLGALTAILQSAMRLMRVSHRDVQAALHALRPQIASIADGIISLKAGASRPTLHAFNPMQDIASMRHECAEARLFAS